MNKDEVDRFRRLGTKWVEIAAIVGVSVSKIESWRRETGYEDPLDHPDDGNLEQIVRDLIAVQPQGHELVDDEPAAPDPFLAEKMLFCSAIAGDCAKGEKSGAAAPEEAGAARGAVAAAAAARGGG